MAETRCVTCILSSSFPGIEFDGRGVCNFCRDGIIEKTTDADITAAGSEVLSLFDRVRGTAEYDAVLCYSGGKDSTYTLLKAKRKYGLKVLAFTLDNGFLSPLARENIERATAKLGVDHVMFRPGKETYAAIIRASLTKELYARSTVRRISAGCQSCISIVNNMALKLAMEKGIPLILAGFTLGQIPLNSVCFRNDYRFLLESRAKALSILRAEAGDGILPYLTIPERTLSAVREYPYTVNLLVHEQVSEREIIEEITEIGWKQPRDVDGCSSNCRLNVLNNRVHEKKYGFNPYELELSHLIRVGQLTREEALAKILDQSEGLLSEVIAELGIGREFLQ